jgi:UDP-N-acetylglucosamine/UDP-N-acetylgalactosamine diphosphorylase
MTHSTPIKRLVEKGVSIPCPETVHIGPEVDAARISAEGVKIGPGCRIFGSDTLILQGARIGGEGPATLNNCYVGPDVALKSGFFEGAVFLQGAAMGANAHVRRGTILEERASGAHTVGLKQTILLGFVTLGSLINFCDCLMAGGTSRRRHSEVGSAYIHFNFTPNQDKATASLIGDVPRGVLLNQPPIFLGGQGGMVGPCRIAFGTVTAAGTICRRDQLVPNRLVIERLRRSGNVAFHPGLYWNIQRTVTNNVLYIGNLLALNQWYNVVRPVFASEALPGPLLAGMQATLRIAIDERIRRFGQFASNMAASADHYRRIAGDNARPSLIAQKTQISDNWEAVAQTIDAHRSFSGSDALRDTLLTGVDRAVSAAGKDYVRAIQSLTPVAASAATDWLQGIVDSVHQAVLRRIPAFGEPQRT